MSCLYIHNGNYYTERQLLEKFNSTSERVNSARDWLLFNTNMNSEELIIVNGLLNNDSLGRMLNDGKIIISNLAPDSLIYHEAFHRIFNLFATDSDRFKLIDEFKQRKDSSKLIDEMDKIYNSPDRIKIRGTVLSKEDLIEEILAEEFREYKIERDEKNSIKKTIFGRILDFISKILKLGKKIENQSFANEFYQKINEGFYASSPKLQNRINNYRDSLSDIKELKLTKGKTLGIEKTLDIVYSIHHEVINHLLKEELYYDLIDGSLTNDLFKIGFNAIYDAVDSSTASSMIDNAKLIKANYYALLKEYKIEKGEELELFNDKLFGDDKSKDTEFNKNSIEFDPRTSQRQAVRLLVSSLVSNEKNSIGQPKIIPIKQVVNLLLTNLSNVPPTIEDFTYTLNKLSNKHPYISQILDILDFASEKGNTRLINDFIASFNNAFVGFDKLITIGGVIEIANANDLATRDQVISTWKQNLIDNINTNRDLIPTLENFTIKNDRDANKFFKLLGIILNNNYTNLKGYAQSIQKTIIDKKYDTKKSITSDQLLTLFNFKKDNNFFIDKELGNNFNVISFLSDFAKEEQKNMDDISIMLFNAENKPIYPVTQYHYLSMVVNWMNYYKNRHLDEQLEISLKDYLSSKMPYLFNYNTESSYWLKAFLVQNGLKMDLSLMSGIDLGLDNRLDFANAADYDYYSVALKLFEQGEANMYSKTLSITQGDRQIMPVFQIKEIVNDSNKYNIFKGYVKSELKRLYLNKKDGLEHMIGFNSEKGNSLINKDIIDINKLFKSLKIEDSIDDAIDELLESIDLNKNLDNHIEKNTNKYEQIFKDMHVKVPKGTYSSQREFIENWYINTYFNNIEQFKLFYGDSSIFRTYSNLWKRLNTPTSTGTPSIASEELLDELDALDNNYTFEGFNYVENKINNGASKNTIKEQFLKDVETSSSNIDFIENKFREYYTNIYSIIPWKDKFSSYFGNETPNLEKLIEEEVKRDSAPFKKIKEADGFSYVNLFEWRRIMKTFVLWTPKHDNLFNQEFEILKISMDGKLSEVEKERAFNEIMSNGYLTLDEYFDDFSQSSLLKPQYSGVVYYKSYEDYINTPIGERANIYGIRKTSFMPLMPSVIFNTNLEVLHNKMLSSGTGITFYDSAAKDGRSDLAHDVNELIDSSENQLETLNGDFSTYLDYQFLKNQVYINTDEKTKIIDSTQSRKQIITDKYHRNIPFDFIFNNKELGFGNIENKWNSLSELEKEQQSDLHKTVNEYITFTNKVLERNKNFLLKEFEIAANEDLTEFELENINQIIKLLKQAAIDRNNSLDIIDSFQYLLESSESTLFNVFPNPTKLQSLITSIVTNNVIKTKRLGNDYAQVSPVMWEKKGQKRINNSKTNNELLKSYSDLSPSEIMIPAPKDLLRKIEKLIIKKDPKIMESYNKFKDKYTSSNIKLLVEILNDLVDTGYLGSEVTLKGLRIPNQELSSNDVFKIKKFLLPTMSKFVVVNAELIAKTGSDFDIDKLNLYFKYLNSNLKEIVYSEDNSEEATKERFESFKQQELEDLLDYFTDKNIEQISQKLKEIKESKKELYDLNKDDLDKLFKQKGISNELKEVFFDKLNEDLNDFLYDINTFNNTELFSLKLNSEQLEDILKVKNLFEFRNELYKVRHQKLKSVSSSLSTLINERNELNQTLNNAFQKLKDKRNPFKNKDFNELHNNYIKSKENVEDFLKNLTNGYPEINIVITQVQNRIENAQSFLDDWKNAKINKETLNKELIDSYFSKISDLKIKEKSLKDLEYELFKTLPVDEQNSMGAIFNKLSEIEQKLILSPLSMANLLHPIGDGGLEELLVSKLEKNVKKEERFSVRESKELSEVVEPENNLIKKNDMKEANIGIAQMATHGTGHAISKKTVISPSFWSSDYKIDLSTELLFEGFENNNDISSSFTQDSENIAQLISGHLTSQVDAASNPYAIYLNIRSSVNPISMYLLRRGVNKEIVYRFLIQPSILEFIKRRDIYTSPLYKNLNYKMSKKGGDILAIKDLEAIIGNPIMAEGLVLKKKDIAINMQNLKSISIKDLKDKSSLEDKSFQKNALFYFLALREQARLFSDYKKLMSSDTDYHKSLNSYQELSFIYEELKKSNFITNLDEMLNTGFIEGFTKAAKLYYYPWKSLFIGHRDFASHTNSYLNSYVNILSENLGFNRSEERKAKLKESMERQLFIYILNNYVNTSKLNPIEVLELGAKSIKAFNINKVLTIDKDYGEVSLKEDIIKSKAKSFHTFELNNYLVFMQKINSLESIKIGDDIITGKEFLKQLYIQSLKQSKNDFSPNDISNIIPGRVKMELLTEIMDKFLEMEKNGKINSNFFANFMVQFQLNNERYILSSPIGHLLGRGEENTIVDSQLNEYFLKGNYYTSDFNSFNTEIVEDTSLISSVKENIEKLNTVDLSNNSIKNLYFLDVASKDTVNGKKSFINKTKIDFEGSNVYLIPQDVFVNDLLSSISRTKIGTFENDELGNFHLKIDLSENISQQTTEQPVNKEIKPKIDSSKKISAKGKMTFSYGGNKRSGVTSTTTFEAIKNGERTATTRYESDGHIDYWKNLKEGDIIEWESANGEKVLVEVTKPLHKLVGSGKTAEQWSKLEGWSVDYFNSKVKPKLDGAWQIEYKTLTQEQPIQNKEGVDFVFEQTPQLSSIGTKEQYSQYLNTIFPDSKVKDVLLHGSPESNLEKFNATWKRGFYATAYEQMAKGAGGSTNWDKVSKIYRVILNIKNPRIELMPAAIGDMERNPISYIKEKGYDSFIINNQSFKNNRPNEEVIVFEPEQIHILGSKQDIEGFKKFIEQPINKEIKPNEVNFDKELAQKIQDKLQRLYPEIKLNITNNPVWEQGDNVFNQLIEDDYFEGNPKYFTEVERISNLVLNKLKFKTKEFNGKYDESITDLQTYKTKVLNDLLKEIGITGVITNLDELKERLNSKELQTSLKENLGQVKESKENFKKQLDNFYSVKRLLNNYLKHFDLSKYDSNQQALIKQYLPNLFKDNKFKSDKQAIAFNKRKINSEEWANKSFNLDKITLGFLSNNAKEKKIETLLNYFKIEPKDAAERIYVTIENELNRREKFFTSEKTQSKINAKIAEDKIKEDNEKAERIRRQNEELNKYKNSTVVQEVEGFLGSRNIHDLESVLESSNINVELATIKNNGYSLDKTPEGKKSDLFVSILNLPEVNGNVEIAEKLKSLVYSEDFTNWFGDWLNNPEESSKIVDKNGEPKLVYHGSGREFSNFEEKERGSTTGKWKDRLSDSEMSFMFTDSLNTAFYYAIIERQEILKEILYYVRKAAQEPSTQMIQDMYQKYPSIKNWVDNLKEKGLSKEEILKEFNRIYNEYSKIRDLTEGGAIGNPEVNNQGTKLVIEYLEKNKESILKNGIPKNDKYNTAIIPGSERNGYPIWLWSSKEYNTITVGNNGILNSFTNKELNGKNIKELTSTEFDLMVSEFKDTFIYNYEKIQDEISAGGFTPKIYPVFLNAKNVNSKDFKNRPFIFQIGDTQEKLDKRETVGAQYEVADLVEEALNTNLDGSIIENIKDPVTATNYAVFRNNQIKSVFNKKDYTSQDNFYNQVINGKIIGQANIRAMSVLIDAVNQKNDTLPHEYAHHYIAWYRNTPIVQEAIKKWGSEEALVQSIGEQVVKQKGEALNWWNKFTKWILDKFNNLSKLQKQELTQILTDAFLTRQDLNNNKDNTYYLSKEQSDAIDNVFDENPELANAVYESLGFKGRKIKSFDIFSEIEKNTKREDLKKIATLLKSNNNSKITSVLFLDSNDSVMGMNHQSFTNNQINSIVRILDEKVLSELDKQLLGNYTEETVLHEEIHRYTTIVTMLAEKYNDEQLKDLLNSKELQFLRELEDLHKIYKENGGYFKLQEFITYGLTNQDEIVKLKNIKVQKADLLSKLIDSILNLLGVRQENLYNLLYKSFENYYTKALNTNNYKEDFSEFEENYLKKITPQQKQQAKEVYQQYINSLLTGETISNQAGDLSKSQVKNVVYHGGKVNKDTFKHLKNKEDYELRNPNSVIGFFFSNSKKTVANQYAQYDYDNIPEDLQKALNDSKDDPEAYRFYSEAIPKKPGSISEQLLNIKKPFVIQAKEWEDESWIDKFNILTDSDRDDNWVSDYKWTVDAYEKIKNYLKNLGYDSLYINSDQELFKKTGVVDYITVQKVVFEPSQIHILSSKSDIEQAKEFISNNTQKTEDYFSNEINKIQKESKVIENSLKEYETSKKIDNRNTTKAIKNKEEKAKKINDKLLSLGFESINENEYQFSTSSYITFKSKLNSLDGINVLINTFKSPDYLIKIKIAPLKNNFDLQKQGELPFNPIELKLALKENDFIQDIADNTFEGLTEEQINILRDNLENGELNLNCKI